MPDVVIIIKMEKNTVLVQMSWFGGWQVWRGCKIKIQKHEKLVCKQTADSQIAVKYFQKTHKFMILSLLENASNYLVGCVIQKRSQLL